MSRRAFWLLTLPACLGTYVGAGYCLYQAGQAAFG